MEISAPEDMLPRAKAADWFEVQALVSGTRGFSMAEFIGALAMEDLPSGYSDDGFGPTDEAIIDDRHFEYADDILRELEWRSEILGEDYPFNLTPSKSGMSWRLRPALPNKDCNTAQLAYVVCLLIAAIRYRFLIGDGYDLVEASAPQIMQDISTVAARELVQGEVFSMGFPRKDGLGFRMALQDFVTAVGVGSVKDPPPASQISSAKDGGIDLIAWRAFGDRRNPALLTYGQVASGQKWEEKSVSGVIDGKFLHWLEPHPTKHYFPSMFIPFMQHESLVVKNGRDFDEVLKDKLESLEKTLGVVVDRIRIAELLDEVPDRISEQNSELFQQLVEWLKAIKPKLEKSTNLSR